MAQNFIAPGEVLDVVAAAAITSGAPVKVGNIIGVALGTAAIGQTVSVSICGAFSGLAKETGAAWAVGDTLYWDATNSRFTKTSSGNTFAGYAYAAALSADATGSVLLSH